MIPLLPTSFRKPVAVGLAGVLAWLTLHYLFLLFDFLHWEGVRADHGIRYFLTGLFVALVVLIALVPSRHRGDPYAERRFLIPAAVLVAALANVGFMVLTKYAAPVGGYLSNVDLGLTAVAMGGVAAFSLIARGRNERILLACLLAGTVVRAVTIVRIPQDPVLVDMLPVIRAGCLDFVRGVSPYQYYQASPEHVASAMHYLPLMWLPYVPLALLDIDLRWLSVLAWPAAVWVLYKGIGPKSAGSWAVLLTLAFSPYVVPRYGLYAYPYWLLLAIALYGLVKNRPVLTAVFLGLSLASRQFALVIIPFFLILQWREWGIRRAALAAAVVSISAAIFIAPFLIWDWQGFVSLTWDGLRAEAFRSHSMQVISGPSVAPLLYNSGLQAWFLPFQLAGLVALGVVGLWRIRRWQDALAFSALAYTWFLVSAIRNATHLFIPVLFMLVPLISFAFMPAEEARNESPGNGLSTEIPVAVRER